MNNKNNPQNFNPINAYDLSQRPVAVPIIPEFNERDVEEIINDFNVADSLYDSLLNTSKQKDYPFMIHCLALPQFSFSGWLQGVGVQRIHDQNGLKPPVTEICLELTRTEDPMSGIIYIPYATVIYLAVRAVNGHDPVVISDNRLDHYTKKV